MLLTENEARSFFGPLAPLFEGIVLDGLREYDGPDYSSKSRVLHHARTKAALRYDHIAEIAEKRLSEELGTRLKVVRRFGRVYFLIDDDVCVCFKKLDSNLRPRNILTRQVNKFMWQLRLFPDFSVDTHVVVGYKAIDAAETRFEVWATCPAGPQNRWQIPLTDNGMRSLFPAEIPDAPFRPMGPRKPRVVPRQPEGETLTNSDITPDEDKDDE